LASKRSKRKPVSDAALRRAARNAVQAQSYAAFSMVRRELGRWSDISIVAAAADWGCRLTL
jgi:hypothetical protein